MTSPSSIPEAAVEAAAEDLYDREGYSTSLADAPKYRRDRFLTQAREVLEAAAPHMNQVAKRDGWDEGWQKAHATEDPPMAGIFFNPYRSPRG